MGWLHHSIDIYILCIYDIYILHIYIYYMYTPVPPFVGYRLLKTTVERRQGAGHLGPDRSADRQGEGAAPIF